MMRNLLIIYHSKDGSTARMAEAVLRGANHPDIDIDVKMLLARDADLEALLWADGLILGTPENFGYMSGALKDFFDRTYYPAEGKVEGLPYCVFICAGNDGAGALRSIKRIVKGFPFKEVHAPLISQGDLENTVLKSCEEMGMYMAAGIESRIL